MKLRQFHHTEAPAYSCCHAHPAGQLMMISEGICRLRLPGQETLLADGAISWIPSGVPHSVEVDGAIAGISLFTEGVGAELWPASVRHLPANAFLTGLFARAIGVQANERRLANLCTVIADEITAAHQSRIAVPMPRNKSLRMICQNILAAPAKRWSVEEICITIGWSRRTFERRFTRETGLSYGRWKTQARMARAAQLLASGKPVTEVTFDVGYDSMSAFSTAFRALTGSRPSDFRRYCIDDRRPGIRL